MALYLHCCSIFNLIIRNKYVYQDSAWKIQPKESREIGVSSLKNCLVLLRMSFRGEMGGAMGRPTYDNDNEYESEYWCHHCNRLVLPLFVADYQISCSSCHLGFVEQIRQETPIAGNGNGNAERNRCCTSPASTTAVQAMPTTTVSQDRVPPECSVCLEDFVVGDVTRQMPCKHIFHPHCILPWLKWHSCCPVCRFQMPAGDHHEHTQNESRSTSGGMSSLQMHIVCLCYRFLRYILTRWNDILYVTLCCIYVTIDFLP